MKAQVLVIGVVGILLSVGLSGCEEADQTSQEKDRFLGTWTDTVEDTIIVLEVYSDGSCTYVDDPGTWDVQDGLFVIILTNGLTFRFQYVFANNDTTLSLTSTAGGGPLVFTKQ